MTRSHYRFLLYSLVCAAFASLLFLPGLPGDFVFDDHINIIGNTGIELQSLSPAALGETLFSTQYGGITRVIPTLTFAIDYYRGGGLDPATFKSTNIAIHALTALVLAVFLRDLLLAVGQRPTRARWIALAMAVAWAAHPLQVSSVLYVVQRMQTLATLFIVLSLWSYLRARQAQIEGRSGRTGWMLTALLWMLALGCKEDAILLPAYTLAMELTVLRFGAADQAFARRLRYGYLFAVVAGAVAFLLVVVPHYWSWDTHHNRNFSSYERLLTQGRVLCLYLWEIVLPLPSHMPFYYDWLQPSRGLLQPWTTIPAWLLIAALLVAAWRLRVRHPLLAFGIFLFFSGHFVTSNVVALELAFEHRNHLPLLGAVLAIGSLLILLVDRFQFRPVLSASAVVLMLMALSWATLIRAGWWSSDLALAQASTRLAPTSTRAWNQLCVAYFNLGGGDRPDNPYLDKAISACSKGADVSTDSIKTLTNIIAMKAIQGTLSAADWDRYLQRLRHVTMTPENASSIWVILNKARDGASMDSERVLEAIEIVSKRRSLKPVESAAMGYFILGHTQQPDRAYPHFAHAVRKARDPAFTQGLVAEMRKEGHADWADRLEALTPDPDDGSAPRQMPESRKE
ncbi:MAG: hypothetical protein ABS96_24945 [Lysobacteraceae bacterium SCN 69-123]|nr:hypothetical protein [Stenotrophomonas acidaminiphila]ODU43144.1 MAG: hypothetical protein ABS96_24945 [Xanthomonadaceae bacterium SCN 69-123]OJY79420.1 MAG: hypothetical protein BGP18_01215 [Stenotrophomonas sp. 69-14]